jgi:hypothetical protein
MIIKSIRKAIPKLARVMAVTIFLTACSSNPTPTPPPAPATKEQPAATATQEPTSMPLPTSTVQATGTVPPARQVLYQDDFSDPNSGWPTITDSEGIFRYTDDGKYQIDVLKLDWSRWLTVKQDFTDVSVELDSVNPTGQDDPRIGIICRYTDDNNFYLLTITTDGSSRIAKIKDGKLEVLVPWSKTPGINPGSQVNHLRVDCVGSQLTLYANEQQLASASDADFTHGEVGLFTGTKTQAQGSIIFDNLVVYQP